MSIVTETVVSLQEATKDIPLGRDRKPVNFTTIWRWAMKGVLSQSGKRVKLEAVRLGGRWITS